MTSQIASFPPAGYPSARRPAIDSHRRITMRTVEPDTLPGFLTRFCSFYDSVIRRFEYCYCRGGTQQLTIELSAQDLEAAQGWSTVILVLSDVSEILFREGGSTRVVLSDGLSLQWIDNQLWCDLSPYSSEITSIADLRRSDFYAVGSTMMWKVETYSENRPIALNSSD